MSLVTVLMPMRNAEPYVRAALESVLTQDGVELEVVVIDDGSTDRSAAAVREIGDPRIRLLPGPCKGISASFNTGLAAARGDIIMRCDADDLLAPGRLERQAGWLDGHSGFGAVCARFSTMTSGGQPVTDLDCGGDVETEITAELRSGGVRTSLCTYAIRTPILREIGGCRSYFTTAEDLDLLLRLGERTRVWFLPDYVYKYRLHSTSATHTQANVLRQFYEKTAKDFAAQRRAGQPDDLERGAPPAPPAAGASAPADSARHVQDMLIGRAWREHAQGRRLQALRSGWRACWTAPLNGSAWKSLVALALKRRSASG